MGRGEVFLVLLYVFFCFLLIVLMSIVFFREVCNLSIQYMYIQYQIILQLMEFLEYFVFQVGRFRVLFSGSLGVFLCEFCFICLSCVFCFACLLEAEFVFLMCCSSIWNCAFFLFFFFRRDGFSFGMLNINFYFILRVFFSFVFFRESYLQICYFITRVNLLVK